MVENIRSEEYEVNDNLLYSVFVNIINDIQVAEEGEKENE